jgi:hypothetical protein
MDGLSDFFVENSDMGGLCNFGAVVSNPRISHIPHGNYFYNAVALELVLKVIKTKHRHPKP